MYEGQRLGALTVSAGVAQADEHRSNPSDLLRAADETLYNAKILGVTACDSLPSEKIGSKRLRELMHSSLFGLSRFCLAFENRVNSGL